MTYKIDLPPYIDRTIRVFEKAGYECYAVGGCVRDSIMGATPHDWDLCTDASPDEIAGLFSSMHILEYGKKHGTVTVVFDGSPVEITTYRTEGTYADNRHPDLVKFVKSLDEDLKRRDFTINAIAYSPTLGIADPFGGIDDIKRKVIRAVGCAEDRFGEDALRIMRALRFSCRLGFDVERSTAEALHKCVRLLDNISRERITSEMFQIFSGDNCWRTFDDYFDIFMRVIPFLREERKESVVKELKASENDAPLRFALIMEDYDRDMIISAAGTLKWDSKTRKTVNDAVCDAVKPIPAHDIGLALLVSSLGHDRFLMMLKMKEAHGEDISFALSEYRKMVVEGRCLFKSDLAISGSDLVDAGIKKETIGDLLDCLLVKVIKGEVANEKEELIREAKRGN